MNLINPLAAFSSAPLLRGIDPSLRAREAAREMAKLQETDAGQPAAPGGFAGLLSDVEAKQSEAAAVTREVLLGQNPNLHQSVIAMQEASLSFSLMVEVRNKVLESYQELMRMPV